MLDNDDVIFCTERELTAQVVRWINVVAPDEGRALGLAIADHVRPKLRWSLLRRYLEQAEFHMMTGEAYPELVRSRLRFAVSFISKNYQLDDPIWDD